MRKLPFLLQIGGKVYFQIQLSQDTDGKGSFLRHVVKHGGGRGQTVLGSWIDGYISTFPSRLRFNQLKCILDAT